MKGKGATILLVLVLVIGVSVLLYPTVSDFWNSMHQSRVVADYTKLVSSLGDDKYAELLEAAEAYNQTLLTKPDRLDLDTWSEADLALYNELLSVNGSEIMGTLEIPRISVKLPVYHGTDESVLQVGIGHIEGTSLPVGGESTHSVLSGHTGLPSSYLLTDLDQMELDDLFYLNILDRTLIYRVDQILVVEPDDVSALDIVEGEDYVTLITCTPYGINSHRLLVRGTRVYTEEAEEQTILVNDARKINAWMMIGLFVAPVFLACSILALIFRKRK